MTTIDRYVEVEVKLRKGEAACYWCGDIFNKLINQGIGAKGWRIHNNIEHEDKIFCCKEHKNQWIYHKQVFGELMP